MIRRAQFSLAAALAAGVLLNSSAPAQVQVGKETQVSLSGDLSTSYSGSYGNETVTSSHGLLFGGNGDLNGSYYSPQFLSFDVAPYYNQSRNSSSFSAINDSSGVIARAGIFSGSRFPGYVNYSRTYNSDSTYQIPNIANFQTNGNTDTLGVGWSVNLENLPYLTFGYQQGSSDTSLYGTQTDSLTNFHSAFGNANYKIDGFHINGGIHYSKQDAQFPEIAANQPVQKSSSDTTTYTAGVSRTLVLEGNTWLNYTRNVSGSDSDGQSNSQMADILSGGVAFRPTRKLSTQFTVDYNDNLAGTVFQQVNSGGVVTPTSIPAGESHSWGMFGQAQYSVFMGMYVAGSISHRQQLFQGKSYDSTAYSASVSYGHHLFGGQFNTGETLSYSVLSSTNESLLGFLSNTSYIRRIGAWSLGGSFNYSQNVQTFFIAYNTSSYSYSGTVSRRLGRLNWNAAASGSKSLLTQQSAPTNFTQNYSMGLSGRWLSGSAGYSKSSGTGVFTGSGITVEPGLPPEFFPTSVLFSGTTYSVGLGSTPIRGLTVNATYVKSQNSTESVALSSNNNTLQSNAYLIYKFRKMYINAGYSRIRQGFSASGLPPSDISSYYFGISRWFKFF